MINTTMSDLNTEVQLLKKEVSDMKMIYSRLDKAIEKISDVASTTSAMKTENCNTDAPIGSVDHPTANPPLVD